MFPRSGIQTGSPNQQDSGDGLGSDVPHVCVRASVGAMERPGLLQKHFMSGFEDRHAVAKGPADGFGRLREGLVPRPGHWGDEFPIA